MLTRCTPLPSISPKCLGLPGIPDVSGSLPSTRQSPYAEGGTIGSSLLIFDYSSLVHYEFSTNNGTLYHCWLRIQILRKGKEDGRTRR